MSSAPASRASRPRLRLARAGPAVVAARGRARRRRPLPRAAGRHRQRHPCAARRQHAALRFLDAHRRARWLDRARARGPARARPARTGRRAASRSRRLAGATLRGGRQGCASAGMVALLGMALPGTDRPVAAAMAEHPALLRGFVEPLTIAALNTPVAEASAAGSGRCCGGSAAPGRRGCWSRAMGWGRISSRPPSPRWTRPGATRFASAPAARDATAEGRAAALRLRARTTRHARRVPTG